MGHSMLFQVCFMSACGALNAIPSLFYECMWGTQNYSILLKCVFYTLIYCFIMIYLRLFIYFYLFQVCFMSACGALMLFQVCFMSACGALQDYSKFVL